MNTTVRTMKSIFEKAIGNACRLDLEKKMLLTGILLTNVLIASFSQKSSVLLSSYDSCHVRPLQQQTALSIKAAGAVPMVRVAYVIPSNRTPQPNGVANLQNAIKLGQQFFKDQMEQNGFGPKTYVFETEDDGETPLIHVVHVDETDEYLRGDLWGRAQTAASNAGISLWAPGEVWVVIPETHLMFADGSGAGGVALGAGFGSGNGGGVSMIGSNALPLFNPAMITDDTPYDGKVLQELGPYPMKQNVTFAWFEGTTFSSVASSWLGALWHETGHAFGLGHDFRNDNNFHGNLMGNGLRGTRGSLFPEKYPQDYTRLEYASALFLNVSHFFNRDTRIANNGPDLYHDSPVSVIPQQGLVHLSFQASDVDGLSFAYLIFGGDMAAEILLDSTTANATFAVPYFTQGVINGYTIFVLDKQGNKTSAGVQFDVPVGNNQAPVPFIRIDPPVPGLNQPIVLNASQSYDVDHDQSSLMASWDVDNDGVFDIEPSLNKTVQYQYENGGNYLIRLKLTDPAGAETISTAVSVKIPGEKKITVESFTLIDADKDEAVAELRDGLVIEPTSWEGKTFSVRANTSPGMIERVEFNLEGPIVHHQVDSEPPYALFGDSDGNFIGRPLLPGEYTLTATPFSPSDVGVALVVSFRVNSTGITSDKTIGGDMLDELRSVITTADGGYLLAGHSSSPASGDKSEDSRGIYDYWIVKIDAQNNKVWDKTFGGTDWEQLRSVIAAPDGGYLLAGYSQSSASGDKTENGKGSFDYWVVKIDNQGNKLWDKTFGGNGHDVLLSAISMPRGGYLLAGSSQSHAGGDKSEDNKGLTDYWVVRIDDQGNKIWDRTLGGNGQDEARSATPTSDGGCLLGGSSESDISVDKSENSKGATDYWIVKLDSQGNKVWDKTLGGGGNDALSGTILTADGGYLLAGSSHSDASGDKSENGKGATDFWAIKIDAVGNKVWDKTFGGDISDDCAGVVSAPGGGYLLAGYSISNASGDKSEDSKGYEDYWILKIDDQGNKVWDRTIGGSFLDFLTSAILTPTGDYLLAGYSRSNASGDKTEDSKGDYDYWIVELKEAQLCPSTNLAGDPDVTSVKLHWVPYSGGETITEYRVKRNGIVVGSTTGKYGYFTDFGLTPDSTYSYGVDMVGSHGIICQSNEIQVTTTSQTSIKTNYKLLAIVFNPNSVIPQSELDHARTFLQYRLDFLKNASHNSVNLDLYTNDLVIFNSPPPVEQNSNNVDYMRLASTPYAELGGNSIIDLIERYDIDIVWAIGAPPDYNFAENILLGNLSLGNETWPSQKVKCSRSFFIHSNSGDARAFDAAAHHVEGTMTSATEGSPDNWPRDKEFLVYKGSRSDFSVYPTMLHLWGRFRLTDEWNGSYSIEGHPSNAYASKGNASCGSSHFVPGSIRSSANYPDYTYYDAEAWQRYVDCYADEWLTYPNFSAKSRKINGYDFSAFNNYQENSSTSSFAFGTASFHYWWFNHIPHNPGVSDGKLNNWWPYIYDCNRFDGRAIEYPVDGFPVIPTSYSTTNGEYGTEEGAMDTNWMFWHTNTDFGQRADVSNVSKSENLEVVKAGQGSIKVDVDVESFSFNGRNDVIYPRFKNAHWNFSAVDSITFSIKFTDQQLVTGTNPIIRLCKNGNNRIEFVPKRNGLNANLFKDIGFADGDGWYTFRIPVSGNATWARNLIGYIDPNLNQSDNEVAKEQVIESILADVNYFEISIQSDGGRGQSLVYYIDNLKVHTKDTAQHSLSILSFSLINEKTGALIQEFKDSVTLDLATLLLKDLAIQAHTFPEQVGSVEFTFDNKNKHTENVFPYIFTLPHNLKLGSYTLKADVYSEAHRKGEKGTGLTATVAVTNSVAVVSYDLVNTSGQVLRRLSDGDILYLDDLKANGQTIVANTTGQIGSLKFSVNNKLFNIQNALPYTLTGDNYGTYFEPWIPQAGAYKIDATPYSKSDAGGRAGQSLTIHLTIKPETVGSVVSYDIVNTSGKVLRRLNDGDILYVDDLMSTGQTIVSNTTGQIGSVKFSVNNNFFNMQNAAPYTLTGDNYGTYFEPWRPQAGSYTLTATPYPKSGAEGRAGQSLTINLTVKLATGPAVVSYDIVNTSGKVLRRLNEGDILNVDDLKSKGQTIVANTKGQIGSVTFSVNNKFFNLQNAFPYTLTGDNYGTYFEPWVPQAGAYTVNATPYSKSDAGGDAGRSLVINFTVVDKNNNAARMIATTSEEQNSIDDGASDLAIYPVPVENELFVKMDDTAGKDAMLSIVTLQGVNVYTGTYSQSSSISTVDLKPGVYVLQVVGRNGFQRLVKFIKK